MAKNLSKKSELFLGKLKAQQGLSVPYMADNYNMEFDYSQNILPDFNQAEQNVMKYSPSVVQKKSPSQGGFQGIMENIGQAVPLISPLLKIGTGIAGLIEGAKEKRRQQAYERNARKDFLKRREEARANNFYATPYTTGRSDDYTMKKGGLVYQLGGQLDPVESFMNYYNQQQNIIQSSLDQLQQGYEDKNEMLTQSWKQKKSQGVSDLIGGGVGLASQIFLQKGGEVKPLTREETKQDTVRQRRLRNLRPDGKYPEIPLPKSGNNKVKSKDRFREKQEGGEIEDTESLYSSNFQSPVVENPEEILDGLKSINPGEFLKNSSSVYEWLFQEEPQERHVTSDIYFNTYGEEKNLPVQPVLDKLEQLGLKPSSVTGGEHNIGSTHYEGKAVDLGLNTTFGGDQQKMNEFYQFLTSEEGRKLFPNVKVRDERARPEGQRVWSGSHLHLEIQ